MDNIIWIIVGIMDKLVEMSFKDHLGLGNFDGDNFKNIHQQHLTFFGNLIC